MSTGWVIVLAAIAAFVIGSLVFGDGFAEWTGRILGVAFCIAVVGGAVYGGFVAVTGDDPLGLGWNQASPANQRPTSDDVDPCDVVGASARFQPGC